MVSHLEAFPWRIRRKLVRRVRSLTGVLEGAVRSAAPVRTGKLRSEIHSRLFADRPGRVAGYVEVYAPGDPKEYAKAATLEYGSDASRRIFHRDAAGQILYGRRFGRAAKLVRSRTRPVHIQAYRYLRGPLAQLRPEFIAAIDEVAGRAAEEEG